MKIEDHILELEKELEALARDQGLNSDQLVARALKAENYNRQDEEAISLAQKINFWKGSIHRKDLHTLK